MPNFNEIRLHLSVNQPKNYENTKADQAWPIDAARAIH